MVAMQQVWPEFGKVDHLDIYERAPRPRSPQQPWVMLCMITSVDGAVAVAGNSGALGGPTDWAVLSALRGCADAIVVGAGTARNEDYGPPQLAPDVQERRLARGQEALPLLAVVSARGDLDPATRLFGRPELLRLYLAEATPPARRDALAEVVDVRVAGDTAGGAAQIDVRTAGCAASSAAVSAAAVVADLGAEGRSLILLEGGPRLNAHFAHADLIDEYCITRSPLLTGGEGGLLAGDGPENPLELQLDRLLLADGMVFARYLRPRPDQVSD